MNRSAVKQPKKKSTQSKKDAANNTKNTKKNVLTGNNSSPAVAPASNGSKSNNNAKEKTRRASIATSTVKSVPAKTTQAQECPPAVVAAVTPNNAPLPPIRKMERAHTFFLTRKLSQIYNTLTTGSKENLSKIPESDHETSTTSASAPSSAAPPAPSPFKFTRSLSMASIPLRQSFRRVFRDHNNKLEKLHEENSSEKVDTIAACDKDARPSASPPNASPATTPKTANSPVEAIPPKPAFRHRTQSLSSSASVPPAPPPPRQPLAPAQSSYFRERRNSFRNTLRELRRTFTVAPSTDKHAINIKWSASLASLQQIDNMVSYEDLSFIDYDKFNSYEQQLAQERRRRRERDEQRAAAVLAQPPVLTMQTAPTIAPPATATALVVRRKHAPHPAGVASLAQQMAGGSGTGSIDANFDQAKNLYRQSLDDQKLRFMSMVNRRSFRLSSYSDRAAEDVLMLDQVGQTLGSTVTLDEISRGIDAVDSVNVGCASGAYEQSVHKIQRSQHNGCTQNQSLVELRPMRDTDEWTRLCRSQVAVSTLKYIFNC